MISLPYVFFVLNALAALSITLLKKRHFDFLTVYVLILILYTLPLFFFSIYDPVHKVYHYPHDAVYISMGIVYLCVIPFLVVNNNYYIKIIPEDLRERKIGLFLLACFSFLGFFYMVPVLLTASNKVEALELNNNIVVSIFYEMFPAIGLLMAYKFKNKKYLLIFLVMTLVVMFLGTRRAFAMSLIGIMIIQVSESFRLVSMYKYILFGIASLMLIILGKTFYGYVLFYGLFDGFNEWKNNFTLNYFFEGSEFLTTSAILQSVAQNNFTVDSINIYKSLLAIQPIPLDFFGFSSSFFNDAFQPILFPSLNYGMAYNPWAEAYSWFGYIGVFVYGLIFPLILTFFWKGYKTSTQIFSILFLVLGITLAFWIQRNSLGSILAYIRNILYPFLMIILLVSIVKKFLVKYK